MILEVPFCHYEGASSEIHIWLRMSEKQKLYLKAIEAVYRRHFFMALSAKGSLSKSLTNCPAFTQLFDHL